MITKIKQYIIERCLSPDMNSMTINRIELTQPCLPHCCSYMLMINSSLTVRQPRAMFKVWQFYDMKILSSISFLTMKMELFQKKFNADHWRSLQAICPCSQICNWSTWCLDGRKVGHFLITIQKSFKLIIN